MQVGLEAMSAAEALEVLGHLLGTKDDPSNGRSMQLERHEDQCMRRRDTVRFWRRSDRYRARSKVSRPRKPQNFLQRLRRNALV